MNITRTLSFALVLATSPLLCMAQDTVRINTDHICIDISYMMPQNHTAKVVNDFSLCLRGDSVVSYLPYMGRAYQPTFGHTDGLNFAQRITKKNVRKGKKGKTIIKFSCRNETITYDFSIEAYPEGSAYIRLVPSNADPIGYKGEWTCRPQ